MAALLDGAVSIISPCARPGASIRLRSSAGEIPQGAQRRRQHHHDKPIWRSWQQLELPAKAPKDGSIDLP